MPRSNYEVIKSEFCERERIELDDQNNTIGVSAKGDLWLFDCTDDCVAIHKHFIPELVKALNNYLETGSIIS